MSLKTKRNILIISSVLAQVAPLIIAFACNWDKYVTIKGESSKVSMGMSLSIGGIICVILVVMSLIDNIPKPNGLVASTIVYILIVLLEPILVDLKLLMGMFVLGQAINVFCFKPPIKKIKKHISDEETGRETYRQFQLAKQEEAKKKGA